MAGAGNAATNAGSFTPARIPRVITVPASDKGATAPFLELRPLVDLFAPGGRSDVPNHFIQTIGYGRTRRTRASPARPHPRRTWHARSGRFSRVHRREPDPLHPPAQEAYNREYVRVLYLHALQRDPEPSGWDAWTNVLNQTGDRDLDVSGFVNSQEYAMRFGEP